MNEFLIYLLKSAGILSLFFLVYQLLLKNDTSFVRNRKFLLTGIFIAAVFPAISFTNYIYVNVPDFAKLQFTAETITMAQTESIDWWQYAGIIYFGIFGVLFFRLIFQVFSIMKLISNSAKIRFENFWELKTNQKTSPFSFFNVIVFNPDLHSEEELKLILKHEKVHARQKHSIDVLLANFLTVALWFNPLSWKYKKSIEQNLEYIADSEATAEAVSKTAYQKALINTTIRGLTPTLSNNFYQSSIKKRIIMLNKKSNSKNNVLKMTLIFPMLLAFMLLFNVKAEAQVNPEKATKNVEVSSEKKVTDQLVIVNGEIKDENFKLNSILPEQIASVNVLKGEAAIDKYGNKAKNGAIEIRVKNEEISPLSEKMIASKKEADKILSSKDALIVVNGKVMPDDFKMNSIEKNKIKSVFILNGEKAIEKYGEKGEKGVISITLKK